MLGLCFLSIPVIWLMLRYKHTVFNGRQDVAKLDTTHPVTNGTTSNTVVEQEFNSSDYESINDFDVNGSDILVHINRGPQREEKNIQTTSLPWTYNDLGISSSMTKHRFSNSNSTESSNNSYLEVIADPDYLNPYQIVKTRECGDDQHSYCLIANKNLRDCSSICNDSSNVQKVQCFRAYAKNISLSQKTLVDKSIVIDTKMSNSDGNINFYRQNKLQSVSPQNNNFRHDQALNSAIKNKVTMVDKSFGIAARNFQNSKEDIPYFKRTSKNTMSTLL